MAVKSLGLGFPGTWIPILALPLTGDVSTLPWALASSSRQWATSHGRAKLNNALKGSAQGTPLVSIRGITDNISSLSWVSRPIVQPLPSLRGRKSPKWEARCRAGDLCPGPAASREEGPKSRCWAEFPTFLKRPQAHSCTPAPVTRALVDGALRAPPALRPHQKLVGLFGAPPHGQGGNCMPLKACV